MTVVRYSSYIKYGEAVTAAGDALMALLAGSQLASHLLQLTEGSSSLLPEVFPKVIHINRMNLTSQAAYKILNDAESHLSAMGVPYALSLHEDYMKSCLELLLEAKLCKRDDVDISSSWFHENFEIATKCSFSPDSKIQLDTLRKMRNCIMHEGGRANSSLVNELSAWPATVESKWVKITKYSPRGISVGDRVAFNHGEMILALAVTKKLAHEANEMLQVALPRTQWADIMIEDLIQQDQKLLLASDRERRANGYARFNFGPLNFSSTEIKDALARR